MKAGKISAPAKLNLTLDVQGKRPDGYHDLCMVMQSVSLADTLTLTFEEGSSGVRLKSTDQTLPTGEKNLAVAAALRFREETGQRWDALVIDLEKRIPVCAGTGGGSSDAAAVLRALNTWTGAGLSVRQLAELGAQIGSDVPYCVLGGTALAEGRGERLTPLPALPPCHFVLCKPAFSISTPTLFAALDRHTLSERPDTAGMLSALNAGNLSAVGRCMSNVFEQVLPTEQRREIDALNRSLMQMGALGACMSGTGSTVTGLFAEAGAAEEAASYLNARYSETFVTQPV